MIHDAAQTGGKGNRGQALTALKSIAAYSNQAGGKRYRRKHRAVTERKLAKARHTITDYQARYLRVTEYAVVRIREVAVHIDHAATTVECTVAN